MTEVKPPRFSSHSVGLPDGTRTAEHPPVGESSACLAALREMREEFGAGGHSGISVADLGCLEGGYSAAFARAGYDVTGIEARLENYECAAWLQQALGLSNLRFVHGDVRDVLAGREFDVVFCSGLLYHLDKPVAFLNLLGQVTRRMLVLNTNYSMPGGHDERVHLPTLSRCEYGDFQNEGRRGHWYHEQDDRWASFGNRSSFWLCKGDLLRSIAAAGFTRVSEIVDWRDLGSADVPGGTGAYPDPDRGMFTAFKS